MGNLLVKIIDPTCMFGILIFSCILMILVTLFFNKRNFFSGLLLVYFFICSSLIFLNYFKEVLPAHTDSLLRFIPQATQLANDWRASIFNIFNVTFHDLLFQGIPAYLYPMAFTFYISENSMIAARFFSTIFGMLILYEIYSISKSLFDSKTANIAVVLLAFSPYFWNMSTAILRDTMATFFLLWFFRLWLLHDKQPTLNVKVLLLFSLIYLGSLRPPIMLVVLFVVVLQKTIFNFQKLRSGTIRILLLVFAVIVLGYGINMIANDPTMSGLRLAKGLKYVDFDQMNKRIAGSSESDSGYADNVAYSSYPEAILKSPLLMFYFMGSPFPWMVKKVGQILALVDSAVLWIIYILAFQEAKGFFIRNKKWACIIFTYLLLGISSSSLVQGNMGAAVRHRMLFTYLIIIFAAHHIAKKLTNKQRVIIGNTSQQFSSRYQRVVFTKAGVPHSFNGPKLIR